MMIYGGSSNCRSKPSPARPPPSFPSLFSFVLTVAPCRTCSCAVGGGFGLPGASGPPRWRRSGCVGRAPVGVPRRSVAARLLLPPRRRPAARRPPRCAVGVGGAATRVARVCRCRHGASRVSGRGAPASRPSRPRPLRAGSVAARPPVRLSAGRRPVVGAPRLRSSSPAGRRRPFGAVFSLAVVRAAAARRALSAAPRRAAYVGCALAARAPAPARPRRVGARGARRVGGVSRSRSSRLAALPAARVARPARRGPPLALRGAPRPRVPRAGRLPPPPVAALVVAVAFASHSSLGGPVPARPWSSRGPLCRPRARAPSAPTSWSAAVAGSCRAASRARSGRRRASPRARASGPPWPLGAVSRALVRLRPARRWSPRRAPPRSTAAPRARRRLRSPPPPRPALRATSCVLCSRSLP